MRVLRRALILDADGYQTPIFSADGRRFAIRGNAYVNSLEAFEFPTPDQQCGRRLIYDMAEASTRIEDLGDERYDLINSALSALNVLAIYYERRYIRRKETC